jgi:4'-phosphopantetheinyl transferase
LEGQGKKPHLLGEDICFNVSHSDKYAVIAISTGEVGVDIEHIQNVDDWVGISNRFFAESERKALAQVSADVRKAAFFQLWTHKEAYLKAIGVGLTRSLTSFSVPLERGEVSDCMQPLGAPWLVNSIPSPSDYRASICCQKTGLNLALQTSLRL